MRDNTFSCYRVPVGEPPQEGLSDAFRAVARRLRIQTQRALAPWEVTPAQARALGVLNRHGPLRLGALSERLHIAPRSATEVVDALEERGLVERRPDPADRRATLVAEAGFTTREEFLHTARSPKLTAELAHGAESLEGFLFPSTYRFPRKASAERICRTLARQFQKVWSEIGGRNLCRCTIATRCARRRDRLAHF